MGRLDRRLEKLEKARATSSAQPRLSRELESYFRALENEQRVKDGLEPLPYSEEDCLEDEAFLSEVLPVFRADAGWQSQEAQEWLDEWERDTLKRLSKGVEQ